jgi:quercetin dioxygenase-like cupin family protein
MKFQRGRSSEPAELGTAVCATVGDVLIDNILNDEGVRVSGTMFRPGSHTFWHSHDDGQILIIGAGRGMVATRGGDVHEVTAGDYVYAPPGEEHWHGAAPDCFVSYTSISLGTTRIADELEREDYSTQWST